MEALLDKVGCLRLGANSSETAVPTQSEKVALKSPARTAIRQFIASPSILNQRSGDRRPVARPPLALNQLCPTAAEADRRTIRRHLTRLRIFYPSALTNDRRRRRWRLALAYETSPQGYRADNQNHRQRDLLHTSPHESSKLPLVS